MAPGRRHWQAGDRGRRAAADRPTPWPAEPPRWPWQSQGPESRATAGLRRGPYCGAPHRTRGSALRGSCRSRHVQRRASWKSTTLSQKPRSRTDQMPSGACRCLCNGRRDRSGPFGVLSTLQQKSWTFLIQSCAGVRLQTDSARADRDGLRSRSDRPRNDRDARECHEAPRGSRRAVAAWPWRAS